MANFHIPELFYSVISFSPDGKWLSASANGARYNPETNFLLFDLSNTSVEARKFPHPNYITAMKYSRDSSLLCVSGVGGTLRIWEIDSMEHTDIPLPVNTDQFGAIEFSRDLNFIATVVATESDSSVRVWDWREAAPVSSPWLFDTVVSSIHFSADGRKLIAIAPGDKDDKVAKQFIHIREIIPTDEIAKDIFPMTQATVAKLIQAGGNHIPTAPGTIWRTIPKGSQDAWLLVPPVDRNVSPGIDISTTRWMNLDDLGTLELTRAMPRVPVCHAKMAEWRQNALSDTQIPDDETPEAQKIRLDRMEALSRSIAASIDFAERNSEGDSETCYRLAQQARTAEENKRSLKFLAEALRIDPKNENSLHLKAVIATDETRHEEATEIFETLVGIDPANPNYRAKYGLSLIELGKDKQALEEIRKVIDELSLEYRLHALSLTALGRYEEALTVFQKLAGSEGSNYDTTQLLYLITGNHNIGNDDVAIELYVELIRIQPGAAIMANVEAAPTNKLIVKALVATLKLTLENHPELAPAENE